MFSGRHTVTTGRRVLVRFSCAASEVMRREYEAAEKEIARQEKHRFKQHNTGTSRQEEQSREKELAHLEVPDRQITQAGQAETII